MAKAEKPAQAESGVIPEGGYGECFVIMPISDPDDYPPGHFARVYEDIFKPAIRRAGYEPKRADDVLETNLIQLDLLRRLLEAPMALCDLSSRNPNVLFELGLRQAFDKPVAIVQEEGTPRIFDISPLRFTGYRKARIYHEVLADQDAITDAITATRKAVSDPKSVNSLVKLLGLTEPASLAELKDSENDPAVQLVRAELAELRRELRLAIRPSAKARAAKDSVSEVTTNSGSEIGIYVSLPSDEPTTEQFVEALARYCGIHATYRPNISDEPDLSMYPTLIRFSHAIGLDMMIRGVGYATTDSNLPEPPRVRRYR